MRQPNDWLELDINTDPCRDQVKQIFKEQKHPALEGETHLLRTERVGVPF